MNPTSPNWENSDIAKLATVTSEELATDNSASEQAWYAEQEQCEENAMQFERAFQS